MPLPPHRDLSTLFNEYSDVADAEGEGRMSRSDSRDQLNTPRSRSGSWGNTPRSRSDSRGNTPRSRSGSRGNTPRSASRDVGNGPRAEPRQDLGQGRGSDTVQSNNGGEDEAEVDQISARLSELQEELMESLKEDISEWIQKTLGDVDIDAENFIEALDNGVILCRIAMEIEKKAKAMERDGLLKEPLPQYKLHCHHNARSATWFARDNTASFLGWCRAHGMIDETLFDSEDLVAHHKERQVIYCLMEISRLGARFGLEPPSLVVMEKEIDQASPPSPRPPSPPLTVKLVEIPPPTPPPHIPSPPPSRKSSVTEEPVKQNKSPTKSPREVTSATPKRPSPIDKEVNRVTKKCKCQQYVNKLSEGVYNVFGKRVFIRLLKGKHLMVRVGGGWDTFENYLMHHDPIQVFEFHSAHNNYSGPAHTSATSRDNFRPGAFNGYLVIRSKYKSLNFVS